MHKIFAKTIFLGKNVVFLPHCQSTNEEAKLLARSQRVANGTVVMTDFQEKGRGQQGNAWLSEPGKNLLFTIILKPKDWLATDQFELTMVTSVALLRTIKEWAPQSNVEIKWPNDIYVNDQKIAGILIETILVGQKLETVFIGIGLNVNQETFRLPHATSLNQLTGKLFDRNDVLERILLQLEVALQLNSASASDLKEAYLKHLRWLNEPHQFSARDETFEGKIAGVDKTGKLVIQTKNEVRYFGFKEINFLE